VFEDTDLAAGARYTYECREVSGSVETISAESVSRLIGRSPEAFARHLLVLS
jgi:hypothetical protein